MSRTLDEITAGFKNMAGTLGLTPQGSSMSPYWVTPPPPIQQTPSPSELSRGIASGSLPMSVNYAGTQNAAQSFQAVNLHTPGFGPPPQYLTPPQYGAFRSPVQHVSPIGQGLLPPAVMPYPPMPSTTQFTPAGDFAAHFVLQSQRHSQIQNMAWELGGAKAGFVAGGAFLGSSLGAAVGAMAGPAGMRMGAMAGTLLGGGGMLMSGAADVGAGFMMTTPIHNRMNAMRIQESSQRWFTGEGSSVGQGLTVEQAGMVARELGKFADKTHGLFNRRDMMNIMQYAGDTGLLDFAGNADKIVEYVKKTAKVLSSLAKITADPDMRANIQLLADMQRMGYGVNESLNELSKVRMYQRASGRSMGALVNTVGAATAANYQGAGLLGGSGMLAGIHGAGVARLGMQSGAISPELAALMGGETGIAQNMGNLGAAMWSGNMGMIMTAAMLQKGKDGRMSIDPTLARDLFRGGGALNPQDIINQAAQRMGTDPASLSQMITRSPELRAQAMKLAGPEGTNAALLRLGVGMQQTLGGNVDLASALTQFGVDPNQANMLASMYQNPEFVQLQNQQLLSEVGRKRIDIGKQMRSGYGPLRRRVDKALHTLRDELNPFAQDGDFGSEFWRQNEVLEEQGYTRLGGAYALRDPAAGWLMDMPTFKPREAHGLPGWRRSLAGLSDQGFLGGTAEARARGGIGGLMPGVTAFLENVGGIVAPEFASNRRLATRAQAAESMEMFNLVGSTDLPKMLAGVDPRAVAIADKFAANWNKNFMPASTLGDPMAQFKEQLRAGGIDPGSVPATALLASKVNFQGDGKDVWTQTKGITQQVMGDVNRNLGHMSRMSFESANVDVFGKAFGLSGGNLTNKVNEKKALVQSILNKIMKLGKKREEAMHALQVLVVLRKLATGNLDEKVTIWLNQQPDREFAETLLHDGETFTAMEKQALDDMARTISVNNLASSVEEMTGLIHAETIFNLLATPLRNAGERVEDNVGNLGGLVKQIANSTKVDAKTRELARGVDAGKVGVDKLLSRINSVWKPGDMISQQGDASGVSMSREDAQRLAQNSDLSELAVAKDMSTAAASLNRAAARLEEWAKAQAARDRAQGMDVRIRQTGVNQ